MSLSSLGVKGIVGNLNPSDPAVQNTTADSESHHTSSENNAKTRLKNTKDDLQNNSEHELTGQEERFAIAHKFITDDCIVSKSFSLPQSSDLGFHCYFYFLCIFMPDQTTVDHPGR